MNSARHTSALIAGVLVLSGLAVPGFSQEESVELPDQIVTQKDCAFLAAPDQWLAREGRAREDMFERVRKLAFAEPAGAQAAPAAVQQRNFIDEEIFSAIERAKAVAAPLASDEEFLRRVYLDLTGRTPSSSQIREFVADKSASKRDQIIDKLLDSSEFVDKWSTWLADLTQVMERQSVNARAMQIEGRNGYHKYLRTALAERKSIKLIVWESINGGGNNYLESEATANFPTSASAAMGPIQDTYDLMLSKSASMFLGLGHYDCLLCHDGRGKLTQLSSWGTRTTRLEAQRMAASFARMRINNGNRGSQYESQWYNSSDVVDVAAGQYEFNTTAGNRPPRQPLGTTRNLTPEYRDGTKPSGGNWRYWFGEKLTSDPMFYRNFANRLWKQMFSLALVEPVDSLDPDRLDPANPPAAPWSLQASHPVLLEKLAAEFAASNGDLRSFLRTIAQSSAYQLSSRYPGEWKYEYVQLFARHYPRRLQAEEVHDVIAQTSGVLGRYTYPVRNGQTLPRGTALPQSEPVNWAMQLPDPSEPRNNFAVRAFMAAFTRGNRDSAQRNQFGSVVQQLSLMNDPFVLNRLKVANSPVLREVAKLPSNAELLDELYLTFLSRKPSERERASGLAHLEKATTAAAKNTAIEDLAWVAVNKIDFLFSY